MGWPFVNAAGKFAEIVQRALDDGPQFITRDGDMIAVVLSAEDYRRHTHAKPDFVTFLLNGPDLSQLDLDRLSETAREVEL